MPIALTVLNPGTGFLRDDTDVVGEMSRDISGIEEEDWIVTAGVAARGAIKFPRTRPGEIDITRAQPGMLDPLTWSSTKAQLPDDRKHFPAIQQPYDLGGARKIGMGAFGMEHNVIRAVYWIESQVNYALRNRQTPPKILNMIGWSRGAFTCLRIADELQKYAMFSSRTPELQATTNEMRGMQVNIFAIDPVPGAIYGKQLEYYGKTALPINVRHFVGIYAEHEARGGMKPVVPQRDRQHSWQTQRTRMLRMPGGHDQSVRGDRGTAWKKGLSDVFYIIQSLAYDFMITMGTPLPRSKVLSEEKILEHYGRVQQQMAEYQATAEVGMVAKVGGAFMARLHGAYTPGKDVRTAAKGNLPKNVHASGGEGIQGAELMTGKSLEFVNDHHFEIFSRLVPDFGRGDNSQPSDVKNMQLGGSLTATIQNMGTMSQHRSMAQQIEKLRQQFPETYKGFVALGIIG